jgi:hypothetical protein
VPTPDHAADALAVAVCELNRAPFTGALAAGSAVRRAPRPGAGSGVSAATLARARVGSLAAGGSSAGAPAPGGAR